MTTEDLPLAKRIERLEALVGELSDVVYGNERINYIGLIGSLRENTRIILENQQSIRQLISERNSERKTAQAIKAAGDEQLQRLLNTGKVMGVVLTIVQLLTLALAGLMFLMRNVPP